MLRGTGTGPVSGNARHFLTPDKAGNVQTADVALLSTGKVSGSIDRYHVALSGLAGRKGVRNDLTRYEAVALALVSPGADTLGEIVPHYPPADSVLLMRDFFRRLYDQYDQRFVYGAPALASVTRRVAWDVESTVFTDPRVGDLVPRVSAGTLEAPVPEHEIPDEEAEES